MRVLGLCVLLFTVPGLAGCFECDPQTVDATVRLDRVDLQVRALPILASGATQVAGIQVPDSHARMEFDVGIDGGPFQVNVHNLRLEVRVDGSPLDVEVTQVESDGPWNQAGDAWSGSVRADGRLVVWWGVDWNKAGVDAVVLDEGAQVNVNMQFSWSVDDCSFRSSGRVDHDETLPITPALATTTFRATGQPSLDPGGLTGASFTVDLQVKNGVTTQIQDGDALAILLPTGLGAPGAALWPDVATQVGLLPADTVAPGETLRVREQTPTPWAGGKSGLAILVVHLEHRAVDGTGGVQNDALGFAIRV